MRPKVRKGLNGRKGELSMNKKKLPLAFWIFIGLVVGIAVGLALMMVPNGLDIAKNYILPWGTIFLNPVSYTHLDVYKRQVGGLLQLPATVHRLHGQKSAPYLDIGQAQLTQQAELGHRPGSDQLKAVPEALLQSLLLRTGMDDPDAGEGELGADLSQPVHPLVQTVQQSDLEGGDQDLQGQTRKAGPGAPVSYTHLRRPGSSSPSQCR